MKHAKHAQNRSGRGLRSSKLLLLIMALAQVALFAQPPVEVKPFDSDSQRFGQMVPMHGLSYNEVTGQLHFQLPKIGDGLLSVSPTIISARSTMACTSPSGCIESEAPSEIGHLGFLGYSKLIVMNPMDGASPSSPHKRLPYGRVSYIDGQGNAQDFKRDYLFQNIDVNSDFSNNHFIDRNLRRITREVDKPFGQGHYYQLNPDGSKLIYQADLGPLGGAFPNAEQLADPNFRLTFYPIELTNAKGRSITFRYHGNLTSSADQVRLDYMEDDFGRRLFFNYFTSAAYYNFLSSISIGLASGTASQAKPLMFFGYEEFYTAAGKVTRLTNFTSPEGYRTWIRYGQMDLDYFRGVNLIKGIALPNGLNLALSYDGIDLEITRDASRTYRRITQITQTGGSGAPIMTTNFEYEKNHSPGIGSEDAEWLTQATNHAWLRVTSTSREHLQNTSTAQSTFYYQNGNGTFENPGEGLTPFAGRKRLRVSTYTDQDGASSTTREAWDYEQVALWRTRETPPTWLLNTNDHNAVVEADTHRNLSVRIKNYYSQKDTAWYVSASTYDYNRYEGTLPENVDFTKGFLRVSQSDRYRQDRPHDRTRRTFELDGYTPMVNSDQNCYDWVYQIDRLRNVNNYVMDNASLRQTGRSWIFYHYEPANYEPGVTPAKYCRDNVRYRFDYVNPGERVQTRMDYYYSGPYDGLKRYEYKGSGGQITFAEYQYGRPSRIELPEGDDIVMTYNIDGTLASKTADGITTVFTYDNDGRLVEERKTHGLTQATTHTYPTPDELLSSPDFKETTFGDSWKRIGFDILGREASYAHRVSKSLEDMHTLKLRDILGNEIGVVSLNKDANGNHLPGYTIKRNFDVYGRMRVETVNSSDKSVPAKVTSNLFHVSGNGRTSTYEWISQGTETFGTFTIFDPLDRMIRTGQTIGRTANQGPGTNFSYSYEGPYIKTTILPDGHSDSRHIVHDWLGRKVWEDHPETVGNSYYYYNDRGLIDREYTAGEKVAFGYVYDTQDRLLETWAIDPSNRSEAVMQELLTRHTYDVQSRLSQVETKDGVKLDITEWDNAHRPLTFERTVPTAQLGPGNLSPNQTGIAATDRLDLSWQDTSDSYIVEFQKEGSQSLIFDVASPQLTLTRSMVETAIQAQYDGAQSMRDAYLAGTAPNFLDSSTAYQWRVRGISEDFVASYNSDWALITAASALVDHTASVNFSNGQKVGSRDIRNVFFENLTDETLAIEVSGVEAPFSAPSRPTFINPGGRSGMYVLFEPTTPGQFETSITASVTLNGQTQAIEIPVSGSAIEADAPQLAVSFNGGFNGDFGSVSAGTTSSASLTLENVGTGQLTGNVSLQGVSNQVNAFGISPASFSLNEGQTATLTVNFTPNSNVSTYAVSLNFDADQGEDAQLPLSGQMAFNPEEGTLELGDGGAAVHFDQIRVNSESSIEEFLLANTEPNTTVRGVTAVIEGRDADQFFLPADAICDEIRYQYNCIAEVGFRPTRVPASGDYHRAQIRISHPGDPDLIVQLTGAATEPASIQVSMANTPDVPIYSYDFGDAIVGSSLNSTSMIFDTLGNEATYVRWEIIGSDADYFYPANGPRNGGTFFDRKQDWLSFQPNEERSYSATLRLTALTSGDVFEMPLTGTGVLTNLEIWPTFMQNFEFPTAEVGARVHLDLELGCWFNQPLELEVEGYGDFTYSLEVTGGFGSGTQGYVIGSSGSAVGDKIWITVPKQGEYNGGVRFKYQGQTLLSMDLRGYGE